MRSRKKKTYWKNFRQWRTETVTDDNAVNGEFAEKSLGFLLSAIKTKKMDFSCANWLQELYMVKGS